MGLLETYDYYINELTDERTSDWLFVKSPVPLTLITFSYLYFVLRCGRKFMEKRPAYSCKRFVQVYNILQIVTNGLLTYRVLHSDWYTVQWIYCKHFVYGKDPASMEIANIVWWYMILKLVDYTETMVFVLRKKNNQISFLHLYHHVGTLFIAWLGAKYYADYPSTFSILLNSTVHVIMYCYYFLSTCGPQVRRIVMRMKPFITIVQMIQFVILLLYLLQNYLPHCWVSPPLSHLMVTHVTINFLLFYNFYRQNYSKLKKQK